HHWIRENNWEHQKLCAAHMPVMITENCYHILAAYTEQLLSPERNGAPITHREANTLYKLTNTVSKLQSRATLNENMETFGNFMDTVSVQSPEMAEAIAPFVNGYI